MRFVPLLCVALAGLSSAAFGQARQSTPIRQSDLTAETATVTPLTIRDASRNSRWYGLGVREVRWAPDGSVIYFRWNERPTSTDLAAADPWYRSDRDGTWVERGRDRQCCGPKTARAP